MTLSEFLLARIAEDEAAARAAQAKGSYPWMGDTAAAEVLDMAHNEGCAEFGIAHFDRHQPAQVLARCEADRRIVLSMGDILRAYDANPAPTGDEVRDEAMMSAANIADEVLRNLASVHTDHHDYQREWL